MPCVRAEPGRRVATPAADAAEKTAATEHADFNGEFVSPRTRAWQGQPLIARRKRHATERADFTDQFESVYSEQSVARSSVHSVAGLGEMPCVRAEPGRRVATPAADGAEKTA